MPGVGDQRGGMGQQPRRDLDPDNGQIKRNGEPETGIVGRGVGMTMVAVAMVVMIMAMMMIVIMMVVVTMVVIIGMGAALGGGHVGSTNNACLWFR
jgi:hypothetical protein